MKKKIKEIKILKCDKTDKYHKHLQIHKIILFLIN